jgi:hypothetical protein
VTRASSDVDPRRLRRGRADAASRGREPKQANGPAHSVPYMPMTSKLRAPTYRWGRPTKKLKDLCLFGQTSPGLSREAGSAAILSRHLAIAAGCKKSAVSLGQLSGLRSIKSEDDCPQRNPPIEPACRCRSALETSARSSLPGARSIRVHLAAYEALLETVFVRACESPRTPSRVRLLTLLPCATSTEVFAVLEQPAHTAMSSAPTEPA